MTGLCVGCESGPSKHGEGFCDRCWHGREGLEVARLRAENEALEAEANTQAEQTVIARAERDQLRYDAMTVYGIVYEQLTAGVVDDHGRIMRATNELAEAGRRFAGPSDDTHLAPEEGTNG
jgi:hypothetical protein